MAATEQHTADEHSAELQTGGGHAGAHHSADPHAEPSAEWGWHGTFPKATNIAGWFTVIALFAMLIGNHESRIEDIYLIGLGSLLALMLIGGQLARLRARRR